MNKEIRIAIKRVIKEWCETCNHTNENGHCVFKEYQHHCAIANLIVLLTEKDKNINQVSCPNCGKVDVHIKIESATIEQCSLEVVIKYVVICNQCQLKLYQQTVTDLLIL